MHFIYFFYLRASGAGRPGGHTARGVPPRLLAHKQGRENWNYHDLLSLEAGAAAYSRDVRSGAASRGSLHTLLLQALRREAGRAGEGALRRVVAYCDTMPITDSEKLAFASLHAEAGAASEELSRLRGEALDLSRLVARAERAEDGKL